MLSGTPSPPPPLIAGGVALRGGRFSRVWEIAGALKRSPLIAQQVARDPGLLVRQALEMNAHPGKLRMVSRDSKFLPGPRHANARIVDARSVANVHFSDDFSADAETGWTGRGGCVETQSRVWPSRRRWIRGRCGCGRRRRVIQFQMGNRRLIEIAADDDQRLVYPADRLVVPGDPSKSQG